MKRSNAIHLVSGLLVLLAGAFWLGTGREGYTRWPNAKLAEADAAPAAGEDELFADIGFDIEGESAQEPDIESRFAFGLAPGGVDPKHLLSVATVVAVAVAMSSITGFAGMRRRRNRHDSSTF